MFTGIVEESGQVKSINYIDGGMEAVINCASIIKDIKTGDSVSLNGACSTVVSYDDNSFKVQFSVETLEKTTFSLLKTGTAVNIELCLTPQSRIGGHFVTGHVDCSGYIKKMKISADWAVIEFRYPDDYSHLVIPKGSIAIDGISLTLVDVKKDTFTCHIIPHTLKNTTLLNKKAGDKVNLEFDIMGKYLYNFYNKSASTDKSNINDKNLKQTLFDSGFMS
ncbi:MAG: riboflavin synthase [bacterium]|nr:riboflavin synthase [bacterium]